MTDLLRSCSSVFKTVKIINIMNRLFGIGNSSSSATTQWGMGGSSNITYETANTKIYGDNYSFLDRDNGQPYSGDFRRVIHSYSDGSRRIDYQTYDGTPLTLHGTRSGAGPVHVQPGQYLSVIEASEKRLYYTESAKSDTYMSGSTFLQNPDGTPYTGDFTRTIVGDNTTDTVDVTYTSSTGQALALSNGRYSGVSRQGYVSEMEQAELRTVRQAPASASDSASAFADDLAGAAAASGAAPPPASGNEQNGTIVVGPDGETTTTDDTTPPADDDAPPPADDDPPPADDGTGTGTGTGTGADTGSTSPGETGGSISSGTGAGTGVDGPDITPPPPDSAPTVNKTSTDISAVAVQISQNSGNAPGDEDTAFDNDDDPGMINGEEALIEYGGNELVIESQSDLERAAGASELAALMEYYRDVRGEMSERTACSLVFAIGLYMASLK